MHIIYNEETLLFYIYVSLDVEQPVYYWEQPWYEDEGKKHIRFPIEDMFIPTESEDFKFLIEHIQYELSQGKKIHVGCIGGHGRTGMVLSALVEASMGDKLFDEHGNKISAVDYVRENYAKKAVETVPQMLFLHYNFGIEFPKDNIKEINKFLDALTENTRDKVCRENAINIFSKSFLLVGNQTYKLYLSYYNADRNKS